MANTNPVVHAIARAFFSGLRATGERAMAAGAKSVARDVRKVVTEGDQRLQRFINGCEEIENNDGSGG